MDEELLLGEEEEGIQEPEEDEEEEDIAALRSQLLASKPKGGKGATKGSKASTSQKTEAPSKTAATKGKKK